MFNRNKGVFIANIVTDHHPTSTLAFFRDVVGQVLANAAAPDSMESTGQELWLWIPRFLEIDDTYYLCSW